MKILFLPCGKVWKKFAQRLLQEEKEEPWMNVELEVMMKKLQKMKKISEECRRK